MMECCPSPALIDALLTDKEKRVHFVGIGGTGMSGYAFFRALSGGATSGSDRNFDRDQNKDIAVVLSANQVHLFPQDGAGVKGASAVVVSAAIDPQTPDYVEAIAQATPIISRKEWLAAHYRHYPCLAVTGTSGKSTTTAMLFEILERTGRSPSLLAGAELNILTNTKNAKPAGLGNATVGKGPLVIEADESDKGIEGYTPIIGIILNLQRDHDEPEHMLPALASFARNCQKICFCGDDKALSSLASFTTCVGETANDPYRITDIGLEAEQSAFSMGGQRFVIPVAGRHNVQNAACAIAAAQAYGVSYAESAAALALYAGVHRRFEVVAKQKGILVIDDYAHNPAKIAAVLTNAHRLGHRLHIWYQPHGYGPTQFMKNDLLAMFSDHLKENDTLFIAPIYYAGGQVNADIQSEDLVHFLKDAGKHVILCVNKSMFIDHVQQEAKPGDVLLTIGGRDPTIPLFAREIAEKL